MIKILFFIFALALTNCFELQASVSCNLCHYFVSKIQKNTPLQPAISLIQKIAYKTCLKQGKQPDNVCAGAVKQMTKHIIKGAWKHYTNPHLVCQTIHFCRNQFVKRDLETEIKEIIKDGPNKQWQKPTGSKILKVMHVSDIHPDLYYTEGSPARCTQPLCCRLNSTAIANNTQKAGYWGHLASCDLPMQTLDVFIQEAKKLKLDAIIWTGDNTPHDIWQQTQSYNINYTTIVSEKLKKINVTVIPAMGNHQSYPVNVYDYNSDREKVLNAGLAQAWSSWLDEKAIQMQRQKGYYSQVYPQLNNVKVISINTQASNEQNWLLLQDPTDPGNFLEWVQQELKQSQAKNQFVYFIGHIPTRISLNEWSMRFNAIIDRYSYTVRGQFFGHSHSDHVSFYPRLKNISKMEQAPLSSYYLVAPSLTTYSNRVPEYRVMEIDFDSSIVLDFKQYRLDLRKFTSRDQNPVFELLYSFKESYGIKDMSIQGGITELRNKLRDDPKIQKIYTQHQCGGICDGYSKRTVFCDTSSSPQFLAECNGNDYQKSKFEKFAGPWRKWLHK